MRTFWDLPIRLRNSTATRVINQVSYHHILFFFLFILKHHTIFCVKRTNPTTTTEKKPPSHPLTIYITYKIYIQHFQHSIEFTILRVMFCFCVSILFSRTRLHRMLHVDITKCTQLHTSYLFYETCYIVF